MNFYSFILFCIIFILCLFVSSFLIQLIQFSLKYKIKLKPPVSVYKKKSKLKRLFIDFPRALARDLLRRDPNEFRENGLHCYCGEQGSGKTSAMVDKIRELKQKYPKVKVLSNFDCEFSDGLITDWRDIVFTNNGKEGIIIAIDELQNWFSTAESKDFPPEMLQEITQQRKQRKMIIATSQRFQRLAKPLREQINILYEPFTVLGCLTFVRVRKPSVDDDGKLDRLHTRKRGTYFFVHDDQLRDSYDTFQKIARQANGGYINSKLSDSKSDSNINLAIDVRKRKL